MKLHVTEKLLFYGIVALAFVGVIGSVYFYRQYKMTQGKLSSQQQTASVEVKEIATKISRFMLLPSDEEPTLATVTDSQKLSDQPFFVNSQNGDKVLIYSKAKKAILYRPSTNIVIEVSPVTLGSTPTASGSGEPQINQ